MITRKNTATTYLLSFMMLVAIIFIVSIDVNANGNTYYIDSLGGADTNDGTSENTPWQTLSKVNEQIFGPGDKILFKRGGFWSGELIPQGSGSAGNQIVMDSYGTGERPIIDGNGGLAAIQLKNQEYWTVQNLELRNTATPNTALRSGIRIEVDQDNFIADDIFIRNLKVTKIDGSYIRAHDDLTFFFNAGIFFFPSNVNGTAWFNNIKIEDNIVSDVSTQGITIFGKDGPGRPYAFRPDRWSTQVVVKNNTVIKTGADGILVKNCYEPLVEYNVGGEIGVNGNFDDTEWIAGIWSSNTTNALFQYNECYGTRRYRGDGSAWDTDWGAEGTHIYQYNYSHDNEGGAKIGPYDTGDIPEGFVLEKDIFRYNISQNDGTNEIWVSMGAVDIYNNVFYAGGQNFKVFALDSIPGNLFRNNIVVSTGEVAYAATATYNSNLYYGHTPPNDPNKIVADPEFIDGGSGGYGIDTVGGYKLHPDSPAIDAGIAIADNGGKDYWGNPLYFGKPDIGAHEYLPEITISGTTYYIDSQGGSDANNGTSENSPWQTLDKVNEQVFEPADKILFKRGGFWSGELKPQGSGFPGNQIVIDGYGTGERPIIDGSGANTAIHLYNQEYWTIQNLELRNTDPTPGTVELRNGIRVTVDQSHFIADDIFIRNLKVTQVEGSYIRDGLSGVEFYFNAGIYLDTANSNGSAWFNNVLIEDNKVSDVDTMGISVFGTNPYDWEPTKWSTNVKVRNNEVMNTGADGILIKNCNGPLIEYNVSGNAGSNGNEQTENIAGIFTSNTKDATLQYNECYGTKKFSASGVAWYTGWGSTGTHIHQYNYAHDNEGGIKYGPMARLPESGSGVDWVPLTKDIFRYNINQNNYSNIVGIGQGQVVDYYNNVFYCGTSDFRVGAHDEKQGSLFRNNIVVAGNGEYSDAAVYSHNLYYGHTNIPNDPYKVTADPMFVDGGSSGIGSAIGYKLKPKSPAINAGVTIADNGGLDYFGNALYYGNPDIGAYEHQAEVGELLPHSNYTLLWVDSEETVAEDGAGINAIDGDVNTIWHTEYSNAEPAHIHQIQIDLGDTYDIAQIGYLPRQTGNMNGTIDSYEVYVTNDLNDWGYPPAIGDRAWANDRTEKRVNIGTAGRYVKLVAYSEVNGNPWTSVAEFRVYTYTE